MPPGHARVLVKLESANPTGSMKDRAALAIVRRAAQGARLKHGDTIVECTSGSTGTSLASVAVALGWRCCTTLIVEDSHCESMRLDRAYKQAVTLPLPHDELVGLSSH